MPFISLVSLPFVPLYVACEFHTLRGACFTFLKQTCHDHSCVPLLQLILLLVVPVVVVAVLLLLLLLLPLIYMTVLSVVVSSLSLFVIYNIIL